jgi:hypothetical protein
MSDARSDKGGENSFVKLKSDYATRVVLPRRDNALSIDDLANMESRRGIGFLKYIIRTRPDRAGCSPLASSVLVPASE